MFKGDQEAEPHRRGRKRSFALAAAFAFALQFAAEASAGVTSVGIQKMRWYVQTSPRDVHINAEDTAYTFEAAVWGTGISGLSPPPAVTGPINIALMGPTYNGRMSPARFGGAAWSLSGLYRSQEDLDTRFGSGTYNIIISGTSIPLTLAGDAYPDPPLATFIGGAWVDGMYQFDPEKPLIVTTSAHSRPSENSGILINWHAGNFSQGTNVASSASVTIPANTFTADSQINFIVHFQTFVDANSTSMPGVGGWAGYSAVSEIQLLAKKPQVFPMTVTSNITATVANASATFEPRPQDVGTNASVYVFALAPAPIVKNATVEKGAFLGHLAKGGEKDGVAVQCVLAQLTASGELKAVSTSSLQAYTTNVLTGQAQAVTILNNVPTVNIAGATFYVGYGSDPLAMITTGVNQRAVSVPAPLACDPAPPQTGWWWNNKEAGRGYSIESAGNNLVFASYLYDVNGRATWLLAAGATSLDGSLFTGKLESYAQGQSLTGPYRPATGTVGEPITLAFNDASHGTMIWPGGTVAIERFDIVPGGARMDARPNQPESGWWWNPQEPGRGFFLEWQGGQLFMAGYMYDDAGNPIWYFSGDAVPGTNPMAFSSVWQQLGGGPSLTGAYKAPVPVSTNLGQVTIQFQNAQNAIMTLPGGSTTAIRRFRF